MNEFKFSEMEIKKADRLILTLYFASIPIVYGLFLWLFKRDAWETLEVCGVSSFISGITLLIVLPLTSKKQRKLSILINDEIILRKGDRNDINFSWNDITVVKIIRTPSGDVHSIKLWPKKGRALRIFGMYEMQYILELITKHLPNDVSVRVKRQVLNWYNPLVFITLPWLIIIVILILLLLMYEHLVPVFLRLF
jgi:hypothetical protein